MAWLIAATLLMIASHALPSAPGPRKRLIRTLGRPGFHVAYSLISLLTLGLLIWAYQAAGPQPWLYAPSRAVRVIAPAAMLVATFLITARLTTPATSDRAYGIYRVTAVPGSLGVLLWALVHLLNLGDPRAVIVFGGLALIALIALIKNLVGAGAHARVVGWLPFAAIARRRQAWVWREIGWRRLGLALLVYASLIYLHPIVIGRDPLSGFR
jgi:uncharacterized membrane protein